MDSTQIDLAVLNPSMLTARESISKLDVIND